MSEIEYRVKCPSCGAWHSDKYPPQKVSQLVQLLHRQDNRIAARHEESLP